MPDRDKVIEAFKCVTQRRSVCFCGRCDYHISDAQQLFCDSPKILTDVLALLKEPEEQKQNWLKHIADLQLANSPDEWQSPEQQMYSKGVFDGLRMAYEMLAYGVKKDG